MGILDGKLPHVATWWPVTGPNGTGGDSIGTASTIECRWEERQDRYVGQLDRRELISNAVIFMKVDIAVGDYLCLGDHQSDSDPATVVGAFKVQRFDKVSSLRSLDYVRKATL